MRTMKTLKTSRCCTGSALVLGKSIVVEEEEKDDEEAVVEEDVLIVRIVVCTKGLILS